MIIPVHHTVVTNFPIAATTTLEAGALVAVDADGNISACTGGASAPANAPIGFAADRNRASESFEWTNRVSDSGNETGASGNLSVYSGSGSVFYVDVDDAAIQTPNGTEIDGIVDSGATVTPGTYLYASTTAGHLASAQQGTEAYVAMVIENTGDLATGIPDEYEPGSSFGLADDSTQRQWVKIRTFI